MPLLFCNCNPKSNFLMNITNMISVHLQIYDNKAAFIMYATGGAEDFFFQRLVFLYPPKVHTNFHNPPKQSAEK